MTVRKVSVDKASPRTFIEKLRAAAASSAAFADICAEWAARDRARRDVVVKTLRLQLKQAGHNYSVEELTEALKIIVLLGVAKIDYDAEGGMRGLSDFTVKLQDLGKVALGKKDVITKSKWNAPKLNGIEDMDLVEDQPQAPSLALTNNPTKGHDARIVLIIDNKPVPFPIPPLTTKELGELITELYTRKSASR